MDNKNDSAVIAGTSRLRRLGIVFAGIGLGSVLAYLFSRTRGERSQKVAKRHVREHVVDDRGTTQNQAALILLNLRDRAFESSDEKLALALGRPTDEILAWNSGREVIDDDVIMKARGIAMHRGVRVD